MQIATVERTVTCLIIPHDVQELDAVPVPARKHGALHSGRGIAKPDIVPAKVTSRGLRTSSMRGRRSPSLWALVLGARLTKSSVSPICLAPVWQKRCWAKTCCPTICRRRICQTFRMRRFAETLGLVGVRVDRPD